MTNEELAVKLAETEQRARSNTRRIDKLEQSTDALTRLATSVEVMATKQDSMAGDAGGQARQAVGEPGGKGAAGAGRGLRGLAGFRRAGNLKGERQWSSASQTWWPSWSSAIWWG